jgi:DNA-binding MarR family transcriptional regulator
MSAWIGLRNTTSTLSKQDKDVRDDLTLINDVFMYMRYSFGYQDCNLSYVNAFTMIAKHAPAALADLPDMLNISRTTITRLVSYLGEGSTDGGKAISGLNYVITSEDPLDTRRKLVSLTVAGEMVSRNVSRIMRGDVTFEQLKLEQQEHALAASKRTPK